MASGMEMLVNALIKASGLSMDDMRNQAMQAFEMFKALATDIQDIKTSQNTIFQQIVATELRILSAINQDANLSDDMLVEKFVALPARPNEGDPANANPG